MSNKASGRVWDVTHYNCTLIDLNVDFSSIVNSSSFWETLSVLNSTGFKLLTIILVNKNFFTSLYNIQSDISERSLFFLVDLKDKKKKFFNHILIPVQSTAVHNIIYVCNKNSKKSSIFIVPLKRCFVIEIFSSS